jgi:hypothetical protein
MIYIRDYIDNLFKTSKKKQREKDNIDENNKLLNIKAKSNNSSSFSHFSTTYISFLG